MMSKVLTKLETKFAIPLEKRKPRMFQRKTRTNHIIPKPFKTMFHLLAAPSPDPITVPEPYPVVDWSNVRFKPALPSPQDLPLLSASKDPEFYQLQKGIYNTSSPSSSLARISTNEKRVRDGECESYLPVSLNWKKMKVSPMGRE